MSWFYANFLKLNQSKTKVIIFEKKNLLSLIDYPNVSLTFDSALVCPERVVQYLGVMLDDTLCFQSHINCITLGALSHIERLLPFKIK